MTKASISSKHDSAYVNSDEVEARIVFDVTVVSDRLTLNVNCAANQSGATCTLRRRSTAVSRAQTAWLAATFNW